jgi:hypothetical protein
MVFALLVARDARSYRAAGELPRAIDLGTHPYLWFLPSWSRATRSCRSAHCARSISAPTRIYGSCPPGRARCALLQGSRRAPARDRSRHPPAFMVFALLVARDARSYRAAGELPRATPRMQYVRCAVRLCKSPRGARRAGGAARPSIPAARRKFARRTHDLRSPSRTTAGRARTMPSARKHTATHGTAGCTGSTHTDSRCTS